jgi:hypothetical protein
MAASDDVVLAAPPAPKEMGEDENPEEHSTEDLIEAIKKKMATMEEY